jgi:tetratricopeptide (TPR) repeat protein
MKGREAVNFRLHVLGVTIGAGLAFSGGAQRLLADSIPDRVICREQTQEAIEACSRLIANSPNDAMLFYHRGLAHSAVSDRWAYNDYSEALGRTADNSVYVSPAGKELRAAIADYSAAIKVDPNLVVALNARGRAYWIGGRRDRALVDYLEAIRIAPDNQEALRAAKDTRQNN